MHSYLSSQPIEQGGICIETYQHYRLKYRNQKDLDDNNKIILIKNVKLIDDER